MEEPITTLVGGRRASDRAVNAWLRLLLVLNQLERVAGVVAHEEEDLGPAPSTPRLHHVHRPLRVRNA